MKLNEYIAFKKLTQEEFGRRVGGGVTQGMVWQWLKWLDDPTAGTRITAERAVEIEVATGGQVSRSDLRPDIYPREKAA
jgi:DNA-binding transcriptional regulator YdaS (Cro superfamily)